MTLRARITLFYSALLGSILVIVFGTLLWIQPRAGLALLDKGLRADAVTVEGVLLNEASEGYDRVTAVHEMLIELRLPGRGLAIYEPEGRQLGALWNGLEPEAAYDPARSDDHTRMVTTGYGPARLLQRRLGPHAEWAVVIVAPLTPLDQQKAILHRSLAIAVPLALLAAALGGWLVIARAMRPVDAMARDADRITASDTARRLTVGAAPDELATLARRFNDLLDRLASALDRQREFMTDASHELRTPASVARTTAEVTLARENRSVEEYRDALAIVHAQTKRMSRLIDEMLLLARADIGRRPLEPVEFYLDEGIRDAARAIQVLAAPRHVTVAAECTPDLQIRGDEPLIRQLVLNLLDNAVRHSPDGAKVIVRAEKDGAHALVEVIDEGPGVPEQHRQRIFERFVKLDAARNHDGGAGLGLPIARWIAEAHGGSLTLTNSGAPGSTFRVVLPLQA